MAVGWRAEEILLDNSNNKKEKINLYTVFHLNLAFSSIPEKDYPQVIEKCFWPLLNICEELKISIGIEAPAYTLEKINEISPSWMKNLKELWGKGTCEFIGSGYAQIIGPIVPAEVNAQNLKIGHQIYQSLLGQKPDIAFVNEQAYSPGLIKHYLDADYKAIIMEWNNPYRYHPEWPREWQYFPQIASDSHGKSIPVIWNNSIIFQKFQRYAQGEIELDEYMNYLHSHCGDSVRFFPLYGNDAEIFDYRPGRYDTEAEISEDGEWNRILELLEKLSEDPDFEIVTSSKVLELAKGDMAFNQVELESPEDPIPVKKQEKYNVTRWALTGRNNVGNNTKCFRIYKYLKNIASAHMEGNIKNKESINEMNDLWKELCFLWSSDFRTHIEEKKYSAFQKRLDNTLSTALNISGNAGSEVCIDKTDKKSKKEFQPVLEQQGKLIIIETGTLKVTLNSKRGLCIESLIFKSISNRPLIGTLPHGFYDDISLGADYYSGHTIIEVPGRSKITDLGKVDLELPEHYNESDNYILVRGTINMRIGTIRKEIQIYLRELRLDISYSFDFHENPLATFRTGIITLIPDAFDQESLFYATHNGGKILEKHMLKGHTISHDEPASSMVSSKHCLGATEGWVEIGDKDKKVKIYSDKSILYNAPMVNYREVKHGGYFLRLLHSIGEIDDTAKNIEAQKKNITFSICCEKT
jgi:hypothetical protein